MYLPLQLSLLALSVYKIYNLYLKYKSFDKFATNPTDKFQTGTIQCDPSEKFPVCRKDIRKRHKVHYEMPISMFKKAHTIKFNGIQLVLSKCQIYYTETKFYHSHNKSIIKKYIPNNSVICIFGTLNENGWYEPEAMGSKEDVMDYVADKCYGLTRTSVVQWLGLLTVSLILLFK